MDEGRHLNLNRIARIGALVGEPARTAMLVDLMDGRALTASELARAARVSAPTASSHLAQLVDAGLLCVTPTGRHRYYRIADAEVARLLEAVMQLAARTPAAAATRTVVGPKDAALRTARTCYDHLAGRLGVAITERLVSDGGLVLGEESAQLTDAGVQALSRLGLDATAAVVGRAGTRALPCRPCMDWSERRFHIAGRVATHICRHCLAQGWLRRRAGTRALDITPAGQAALQPWLGWQRWRHVVP